MQLADYLLDHAGWDWRALLHHWRWLLPARFTVWLVNRFGDLFICAEDGSVHHLDVGAGTLRRVADSRDAFCTLCDAPDEAVFFLLSPLVGQLVASSRLLSAGECYSYRVAPAFEGALEVDNVVVRPVADHYSIFGPQHMLTRDIPDGTAIEFSTEQA